MKDYFNKALFFKEWKVGKWLCIALALAFMYIFAWRFSLIIGHIDLISHDKYTGYQVWVNGLNVNLSDSEFSKLQVTRFIKSIYPYDGFPIIIVIFICAVVIFGGDRFKVFNNITHAMPFKRKTILGTKTIMAFSILTFSIVLTLIIMLIMCRVYNPIIGDYFSYIDVIRLSSVEYLAGLFIISIVILGQCLSGKVLGGTAISVFILFVSEYVSSVVSGINYVFLNNNKFLKYAEVKISKEMGANYDGNFELYIIDKMLRYENFNGIRIIAVILIVMIICVVSFSINKSLKFEMEGNMFMFSWIDKVFYFIVALTFSLVFSAIALEYIQPPRNYLWNLTSCIGVIVGLLVFNLFREKVLERVMK